MPRARNCSKVTSTHDEDFSSQDPYCRGGLQAESSALSGPQVWVWQPGKNVATSTFWK